MEDIFKFADALGPLKVIHVYEPSVNLKALLVVKGANIPFPHSAKKTLRDKGDERHR